jgi:hypothetical protein
LSTDGEKGGLKIDIIGTDVSNLGAPFFILKSSRLVGHIPISRAYKYLGTRQIPHSEKTYQDLALDFDKEKMQTGGRNTEVNSV